ncbi:Fic family protein [Hymenobacter sp. ASUV-10]|uniref:Fic family protein n=1 Tax=Hymenobacter aranciens TaxID=3063996 RepID=A0ABT9BED3_9BACT|nr:Fic family protein [Hymenobacter sp. ASUV-10]MDO7876614.1 Fic family protein [Hymenobacter sp. ASUV-10]
MSLFTTLDHLKADLDALRPLAPEQEQRVLQKFRLEWNYNSNAIEGNSLTLGETRSLLLHGLTAAGKPMRDHLDIKGHNEAVLWLEDFVRDDRPLTEQFIRGMHEVLLGEAYYAPAQTATGQSTRKMIVPGQYKQQPNNVLTATGEMFYFASPEETPARMMDLVDWYRQEEAAPTMHPVALAAEFHYRFVRIHPFDDGNGRMSRLLMNLILMRHGYPMTVIQATDRNRYLAALAAADAGDPEPFLRFIIENVEAGLRLMIRAAKGESIDEPDDLDKKLALLKKQVLMREDVVTMTWNTETQTIIWDKLIEFWLTDLMSELVRFDELFLRTEILFSYPDLTPKRITHNDTPTEKRFISNANRKFDGAITIAKEAMSTEPKQLLTECRFSVYWLEFRILEKMFNFHISLELEFDRHGFDAFYNIVQTGVRNPNSANRKNLLNSLYKPEYDLAYIKALNHQLATKVYDFIAAKVAEADSPPS